ncbi:MAG: deoxyribodipyrimidine photo-lyase [bacterium]|nr:deoxyribodipyrimidine photo-lyase [bacterium]
MIQEERVRFLNELGEAPGRYVLYWMQQAQRVAWNHALEYAIRRANERSLPVVVGFGLTDHYPEANERHYAFLLEGLKEVDRHLRRRGIRFVIRYGSPDRVVLVLAKEAALVVTDRGYLKVQRSWRKTVAEKVPCQVVEVESDAVVPVEVVSDKEEYAARTIRPKIHRHLEEYLVPVEETDVKHPSVRMSFKGLDAQDVDEVLKGLKVDRSVGRVRMFKGGASRAHEMLDRFVAERLATYAEDRNRPALGAVSHMSPYLHFGQISSLEIAMRVQEASGRSETEVYLEELIVRRELSLNLVWYNPGYHTYEVIPEWAQKTLAKHEEDAREFLYDREAFEAGETHDPYWNAAQQEMVATGKMHNYMRMYWGKKVLEWSETPGEAFETALYLNNKYELDGRDANSYAGVAWCFGKHDRPWKERSVFGTVRYMNSAGLDRKFNMDAYVQKVAALV